MSTNFFSLSFISSSLNLNRFPFKDVKEETEIQGASQEKKVKEASEDLINHLGEDSPAADEINKQVQEVDSVRQSLIKDMSDRVEKVRSLGNTCF